MFQRAPLIYAGMVCLFCLSRAAAAMAASAPMSTAQLAVYQGVDRERILIDGAQREGQLTLYTSHTSLSLNKRARRWNGAL